MEPSSNKAGKRVINLLDICTVFFTILGIVLIWMDYSSLGIIGRGIHTENISMNGWTFIFIAFIFLMLRVIISLPTNE